LSPLVSLCFPHIVAHVSLRWKVCSPSRGLVSPLSPHIYTSPYPPPCPNASHCFHCPPLLSLSPHIRTCEWWARFPAVHLCWMVRPYSRALLSPGLPACLPCLPTCVPVADDAPAFPRSCPALSVLDAVSVFPRSCPPLSPFLFPILDGVSAFLKPCLPSYLPSEVLSSLVPPFFPLSSRMCAPHVCLCCVTAVPRSCLPLSLFSQHVCLCWMVRPPSRGLASACLP
jgi:hypothetical protein